MTDLIRFISPKLEKMYTMAASNGREAIYASVANADRSVHCDDVTVALARTVYECFYTMERNGLNPSAICKEVDFFKELMDSNLDELKANIWSFNKEREQ